MQRRHFLAAAAASAVARPFDQPIGLNLFTVRNPLAKAPAETYKALAQAGIQTLEVRPPQLLQHAAMMRDAGLKPVHMFIESAAITGAWEEWHAFSAAMAGRYKMPPPPANAPRPTLDAMIALAKQHGLQRIGTSMLLPGERATAIAALNRAAATCAAAGLELYYHNHAYEFAGAKGSRYLDRLKQELDPRVRLELDIFWAAVSNQAPDKLLREWKGRVRSIHLKDMAPDAPRGLAETDMPPTAFRSLGEGVIALPAVLKAARAAGVEHYLIELDHTPGDPLDSVRKCVSYLKRQSL